MDKPNLSELGYNQLPHYGTHAIERFEHFAKELPVKMVFQLTTSCSWPAC